MRKKMLSLALALMMCLGLTVPAFAADYTYTEVVPCKYDRVGDFSEGLAAVCLDGKWGFIDKTGKEVIPCKYDNPGYNTQTEQNPRFSEGLAAVCLDGKWGYIDQMGNEVISIQYDAAVNFSEGFAVVGIRNGTGKDPFGFYYCNYGFIDKTGNVVIPLQYSHAMSFSDGLAPVRVNGLTGPYGYIDKTGEVVVSCKYYYAHRFSEGLAVVRDEARDENGNRNRGYVDKTGNEVVPLQYAEAGNFSEGLASVYVGAYPTGHIGFIDRTGKIVIPAQYGGGSTAMYSFSEGLAAVEDAHGGWGYIDKTGKEVIPLQYTKAGDFSEGLAVVARAGQFGYIDKTGKEVVPRQYTWASSVSEGMAAVAVGEGSVSTFRWGFISFDSASSTPSTPSTSTTGAVLSPQTLAVDGENIDCEKYNIGGSNYFKLRDLAYALNGTGSQFGVGYDEATATVTITTGEAYTPTGTEMATGVDNSSTAHPSSQIIKINGVEHGELTVYNIGGSNFFQLRELGSVLGFEVGYDVDTNTATVTSAQK